MIRWVEIAGVSSKLRYSYQSEFLNKMGIENQVDFVETVMDDFPNTLKRCLVDYDHVRISSPFGEKVPLEVNAIPAEILVQKAGDCMIKDVGHWWVRSMLCEGLTREVALIKKLDISETAFIVGAGSASRSVVAALLKMGFKKFNLTEKFEERGRLLLQDLKSTYFGVDFRLTQQSGITQLPGIHSIVVNTTPLIPTNDLLNELYYFNFLKTDGVVIDLTLHPYETPLLKAAKQVGARIVHGCEVATLVDVYWAKAALGVEIDQFAYGEGLKKLVQEAPFDLSGFDLPDF